MRTSTAAICRPIGEGGPLSHRERHPGSSRRPRAPSRVPSVEGRSVTEAPIRPTGAGSRSSEPLFDRRRVARLSRRDVRDVSSVARPFVREVGVAPPRRSGGSSLLAFFLLRTAGLGARDDEGRSDEQRGRRRGSATTTGIIGLLPSTASAGDSSSTDRMTRSVGGTACASWSATTCSRNAAVAVRGDLLRALGYGRHAHDLDDRQAVAAREGLVATRLGGAAQGRQLLGIGEVADGPLDGVRACPCR